MLGFAPAVSANYYNEGNEGSSESDAYVIDSLGDFTEFRKRVNDGSEPAGKYYKLEADISLLKDTYSNWEAIGTERKPFTGHFNGNGHTIKLHIDSWQVKNASLFGTIKTARGYAIKNLNVNGTLKGRVAGGIALNLYNASIEDCTFSGEIYSEAGNTYGNFESYAGGIVESMYSGTIKNCVVQDAEIISMPRDWAQAGYAGGIVSRMYDGLITGCITSADVVIEGNAIPNESFRDKGSAPIKVGGIIGALMGGSVINNEAFAEISAKTEKIPSIGGIIGQIEDNEEGIAIKVENNRYGGSGYGIGYNMDGEASDDPGLYTNC